MGEVQTSGNVYSSFDQTGTIFANQFSAITLNRGWTAGGGSWTVAALVVGLAPILRGFTPSLEDACATRNGAVGIVRFTVMPISLTGGRGGRCQYNRDNGDASIHQNRMAISQVASR
jgi:hypothetical protein